MVLSLAMATQLCSSKISNSKGSSAVIKGGTKVKNIRLNYESDHNLDCKVDGIGAMGLKSEFVKKA